MLPFDIMLCDHYFNSFLSQCLTVNFISIHFLKISAGFKSSAVVINATLIVILLDFSFLIMS